MSDYGLLTKNSFNGIQIDSTYRNLSYDEGGNGITVSNAPASSVVFGTDIYITGSPLVPLILLRPNTDRFITLHSYHKNGSNFDYFKVGTEYGASTVIDWKSYRENRSASSESYGLRIFNPSNNLCFDSGKSYFKIYSIHTISLDNPPVDKTSLLGDSVTITHSEASDPFYILSPGSHYATNAFVGVTPPDWIRKYWKIGIKKVSSTSVSVGWYVWLQFYYRGLGGVVGNGLNPTMKLLVCS